MIKPNSKFYIPNSSPGQSLIETIGAIFILTMALSTALGVAVYALSRSGISQQEIIATNLAREGIDVVRMMRDSNWLAGAAKDPTGAQQWGLQSCSDINGALCFPGTYQKIPSYNAYDIAVNTQAANKRVVFDSSTGTWDIDGTAAYNLYLEADGTYNTTANGTSTYGRMINITSNTASPYTNQNSNWELIIKSVVAWRGKGCTTFVTGANLLTLSTPCKIVAEEHLTNWKDYK